MTTTLYPWDYGITHFTRRLTAASDRALTADFVGAAHIRSADPDEESDWMNLTIDIATEDCERFNLSVASRAVRPFRDVKPKSYEMWLSGFPVSGEIWLQRAPIVEVTSLTYIDGDGVSQSLSGSPITYAFTPNGEQSHAVIKPLCGASFPTTQTRDDAVVITFTAGYASKPPALVRAGIMLMAGELYKQRSLSVQAVNSARAELGDLQKWWGGPF